MVQHRDSVPFLNCTSISIDSPHMHRDGAGKLILPLCIFLALIGCLRVFVSNKVTFLEWEVGGNETKEVGRTKRVLINPLDFFLHFEMK